MSTAINSKSLGGGLVWWEKASQNAISTFPYHRQKYRLCILCLLWPCQVVSLEHLHPLDIQCQDGRAQYGLTTKLPWSCPHRHFVVYLVSKKTVDKHKFFFSHKVHDRDKLGNERLNQNTKTRAYIYMKKRKWHHYNENYNQSCKTLQFGSGTWIIRKLQILHKTRLSTTCSWSNSWIGSWNLRDAKFLIWCWQFFLIWCWQFSTARNRDLSQNLCMPKTTTESNPPQNQPRMEGRGTLSEIPAVTDPTVTNSNQSTSPIRHYPQRT